MLPENNFLAHSSWQELPLALQREDEDIGFIMVPSTRPKGTFYPTDLLRKIACAFAETEFGRNTHAALTDRIGRLSDEALDEEFISLLSPLMADLFLAETGELRTFYKQSKKGAYALYFKKHFKKVFFLQDGQRHLRLNLDQFDELSAEICAGQEGIVHFAKEAAKTRLNHSQLSPTAENKKLIQAFEKHIRKEYRIKHQQLRNLEVQFLLNFETFRRFEMLHQPREALWEGLGMGISFLALALLMPSASVFVLSAASSVGALAGRAAKVTSENIANKLLAERGEENSVKNSIRCDALGQIATYSYDSRSTQFAKALVGLPSHTEGTLNIEHSFLHKKFRFSLKENQPILQLGQIDTLRTLLLRAIKDSRATPENCLEIIKTLERVKILQKGIELSQGFLAIDAHLRIFAPILSLSIISHPEIILKEENR